MRIAMYSFSYAGLEHDWEKLVVFHSAAPTQYWTHRFQYRIVGRNLVMLELVWSIMRVTGMLCGQLQLWEKLTDGRRDVVSRWWQRQIAMESQLSLGKELPTTIVSGQSSLGWITEANPCQVWYRMNGEGLSEHAQTDQSLVPECTRIKCGRTF